MSLRDIELMPASVPATATFGEAAAALRESRLPAIAVVDAKERVVGLFTDVDLLRGLFPAYLGELRYAAFVPDTLDEAVADSSERRHEPVSKYMNTEHIDVPSDWSDSQIAETFLHHRVLIIPVADRGQVKGIITRWDFFNAVADRLRG